MITENDNQAIDSGTALLKELGTERYRQLVDMMLKEIVQGSPLLELTDKSMIGTIVSRIAFGALCAEADPMGVLRKA